MDGQTNRRTHDRHNAKKIACWPLASGASKKFFTFTNEWTTHNGHNAMTMAQWPSASGAKNENYKDSYRQMPSNHLMLVYIKKFWGKKPQWLNRFREEPKMPLNASCP